MKFILIDSNQLIVQCWKHHYQTCLKIVQHYNLSLKPTIPTSSTSTSPNEFEFYASTIEDFVSTHQLSGTASTVSPGNSLSYMGGGFDKYLLQSMLLGTTVTDYKVIEHLIQDAKLRQSNGYLIPNHIYRTNLLQLPIYKGYNYRDSLIYKNLGVDELIQIPTMIVPEKIHSVRHLFDSIWSLLSHIQEYDVLGGKEDPKRDGEIRQIQNLIIPGIGTGYGHLNEFESTKIMIFAMFVFHLDLKTNTRLNQLKKSMLILFFFNKDYRLFQNETDLQELENLISDYGKSVELKPDTIMDLDEVFKCIKF
ncbi:hypothetical protein CORT_0B08350 [Candida orthopsilosis Co 90-125]|uniref:Macro-like domain-containing protein n=1 Tax=Candida orthopsilosis (strain 90-125) TaxID=1136231 RepID=H8X029_CANO9|nr:hypothetical protein CORT_0B08350 [Candida orthopsilosis Co 90-125]CCG22540.1 hypothetical protein CORT_0B08350 [Candida orthopsilosis Co 90-125]